MNITEEIIKEKIILFLKKYGISEKSRIIVAFSGGPDSSALLWILNDLSFYFGYSLEAVYINHGIRSALDMQLETEKIKNISELIEIQINVITIEQGLIVEEAGLTGRSIEEIAREYRYSILEDEKRRLGATHIAMGHTLDDQSETLIMRFFQGSGVHGLIGIPEKRKEIIRPLLVFEKKDLTKYIENKNIPYVLDQTNFETVYLRNKVRLKLIPVISEIFPGYQKSLMHFSEKMELLKPVLEEYAMPLDVEINKNGEPCFLLKDYLGLSSFRQLETLYRSWNIWVNRPFDRLSFRFLQNALGNRADNSSNIVLQGSLCKLVKEKESLIWKRVVVVSSEKSYLKVMTKGNNIIYLGLSINLDENAIESKDAIWLEKKSVKRPLLVRNKVDGDSISLEEGVKPLKKLYQDWGVLTEDRWKIPVLEDRSDIIAVLGRPFGYSNRIALKYKNCSPGNTKLVISAHYMEKMSEQ
ncbi:MAG: tRNA lysidine(34) synthetase TilS [Spirochaetaceae bacterium]|nr:tRNA lysidine(34) synthetase TilS [Spirochaetaceae bacterium]